MPPDRTCSATTADGSPCGAPSNLVDPNTGHCPSHAEGASERLRQAARKGGRATARKLKRKGLDENELPPLKSPQTAERWLEAVARAVATGRLGHNEGRTVARLIREWLRANEAGEIQERIEVLEEKLAAAKRGDLEVVR